MGPLEALEWGGVFTPDILLLADHRVLGQLVALLTPRGTESGGRPGAGGGTEIRHS